MEAARGAYVVWQEVVVSNDKGRRVVHYYLKGAGGGADLAVVGREKSVRHMSYTVPNQFARSLMSRPHLMPSLPSSSSPQPPGLSFKWRSRREVIDWLSSLVSDPLATASSFSGDRSGVADIYEPGDMPDFKFPLKKTRHSSSEFQWLGAPWQCKKRKRHYRSFSKNGITISVHDFVFVMVEENNRLVAYVDDLYEDLQGDNNMVVVRWFHKVDEVGIVLPPDTNDREIFFSLCLQDFSVECIDGLAAVLSAQHFEQFQNEARRSSRRPYMCRRQINNDGVKPFDITQLQGYWSQDLVRALPISTSPFKLRLKIKCGNSSLSVVRKSENASLGSLKRMPLMHPEDRHSAETSARDKMRPTCLSISSKFRKCATKTLSGSALIRKELFKQKLQQQFCAGYHVEVLSQDSGMRGCWFRCVIVKRHQDKAKVRYLDIQDPDEKGNLEEWVSLSRVAAPDKLGVRYERPIVRPNPSQCDTIRNFEIGAIVDAWWHDGWWEGIIIRKESGGRLHVHFPGENCFSIFSEGELRQSQDWISNKWNAIPNRADIAISLSSHIKDPTGAELIHSKAPPGEHLSKEAVDNLPANTIKSENTSSGDSSTDKDANGSDLTSAFQFKLKWSTSRKRKHRREVTPNDTSSPLKKQHCQTSSSGSENSEEQDVCGGGSFVLPKSLAVDHDNCKIGSDHMFNPPLSSLVMSQ